MCKERVERKKVHVGEGRHVKVRVGTHSWVGVGESRVTSTDIHTVSSGVDTQRSTGRQVGR
jgi:hypothetical protein